MNPPGLPPTPRPRAATAPQLAELQASIDGVYRQRFAGAAVTVGGEGGAQQEVVTLGDVGEQGFGELGRSRPEVMRALLAAQERDAEGWAAFQSSARQLKLQRSR
jgi:hypothetical protein